MNKSTNHSTDIWERMWWIWSAIFYITLIVPTLIAINDPDATNLHMWPMLITAIAFGLWHAGLIFYIRHVPGFRGQTAVPLIYIAGWTIFFVVLVSFHGIYFYLLFSIFSQVFSLLRIRLALIIAFLLTLLMSYLQDPTLFSELSLFSPTLWFFVLITGTAGLFAYWIHEIIAQSAQRRFLIEQLEATRAELATAERREGILQERERLAREIHDTLAQGFIGIIIHLEAGEQQLGIDSSKAQHHLAQAQEMARHALAQARRVVQDLRPEVLESAPLPEAIERVVHKWRAQSGINAHTAVTGAYHALHPEIEVTLIRATQEALANIQKHAHATEIQLTLSYIGDLVILDVQDNGIGLANASPSANGGGYGLIAMRQRVEQVGGQLTIESEPNEGTTIAIHIPTHL